MLGFPVCAIMPSWKCFFLRSQFLKDASDKPLQLGKLQAFPSPTPDLDWEWLTSRGLGAKVKQSILFRERGRPGYRHYSSFGDLMCLGLELGHSKPKDETRTVAVENWLSQTRFGVVLFLCSVIRCCSWWQTGTSLLTSLSLLHFYVLFLPT